MGKVRNFLIKSSLKIAGLVAIFSACCVDSEEWVPFFVAFCISAGWICLVGYANNWFEGYLREE